jgi:hypothetical protein
MPESNQSYPDIANDACGEQIAAVGAEEKRVPAVRANPHLKPLRRTAGFYPGGPEGVGVEWAWSRRGKGRREDILGEASHPAGDEAAQNGANSEPGQRLVSGLVYSRSLGICIASQSNASDNTGRSERFSGDGPLRSMLLPNPSTRC